jgi:hypothetical protein
VKVEAKQVKRAFWKRIEIDREKRGCDGPRTLGRVLMELKVELGPRGPCIVHRQANEWLRNLRRDTHHALGRIGDAHHVGDVKERLGFASGVLTKARKRIGKARIRDALVGGLRRELEDVGEALGCRAMMLKHGLERGQKGRVRCEGIGIREPVNQRLLRCLIHGSVRPPASLD